jgi:hypothetical protein
LTFMLIAQLKCKFKSDLSNPSDLFDQSDPLTRE